MRAAAEADREKAAVSDIGQSRISVNLRRQDGSCSGYMAIGLPSAKVHWHEGRFARPENGR